MNDFGFYLVMTNPVVGYAKCAEAAVKAGVKIIQLRMKHASREEILREARKVRRVTSGTDTLFIVNDDPDIASEAGADGVHVGQDDLPPSEIRMRYPNLRIIGLSTHNINQACASTSQPIDYIGVGPVYATPTKDIPDPTLGLATMGEMIAAAAHPAVAIGGIDLKRLPSVIAAGARNFAVVRAVCQSPTPYDEIQRFMTPPRSYPK
ncbi:MAG: thiamine phosphate synthase [Kiritimatiellae bacterium]|nr:thiamine phosphate synthase [Kiritimatiellia bacterium]